MTPRDLATAVASLTPVDEREQLSIEATLAFLAEATDPCSEDASDHHVTGSAFVVSSRGVILHRHRKLGIWVQPGGHVDSGETPAKAALRESREETGLTVRLAHPVALVHVDVHPGPRGHTHYDFRYVVVADPDDPAPPPDESPDVFWFPFDQAVERCEPALAPALRRLGGAIGSYVGD